MVRTTVGLCVLRRAVTSGLGLSRRAEVDRLGGRTFAMVPDLRWIRVIRAVKGTQPALSIRTTPAVRRSEVAAPHRSTMDMTVISAKDS